MGGMRLEWAQFGAFDSFDVLRSSSSMDVSSLPNPIATGLLTMFYVDTTVIKGMTYYYRVVAWRGGAFRVSDELKIVAGGDEYWDKVVALLHFDGNLTDETSFATFSPVGNVAYDVGRFGSAINLTPLSSSAPNGVLASAAGNPHHALGAGDFTIELFVNPSSMHTQSSQVLLSLFDAASVAGWQIDTTSLYPIFYQYDGGGRSLIRSAVALNDGVWSHIAVCRFGGTVQMFINGISIGSAGDMSDYGTAGLRLSIGYQEHGNARYPFTGMIDELRITKGVARYIENFIPPDAPFPGF